MGDGLLGGGFLALLGLGCGLLLGLLGTAGLSPLGGLALASHDVLLVTIEEGKDASDQLGLVAGSLQAGLLAPVVELLDAVVLEDILVADALLQVRLGLADLDFDLLLLLLLGELVIV